jgi:hypothetical protein
MTKCATCLEKLIPAFRVADWVALCRDHYRADNPKAGNRHPLCWNYTFLHDIDAFWEFDDPIVPC